MPFDLSKSVFMTAFITFTIVICQLKTSEMCVHAVNTLRSAENWYK